MDSSSLTTVHRPDADLAAALADLAARVEGEAGPPIGERKHAQLRRLDDAPWTAVVAAAGDGAPVGYAHVRWERPEQAGLVATVELAVTDDALASRLLAGARAAIARAGGGRWQLWAHHATAAEAARGAALEPTRRLLVMRRPVADDAPPEPVWPEEVELAAFREGRDDDALIEVNNAAFAEHPEQGGWQPSDLEVRRAADWYDPDDVLLAWRGDELLGFHWTKRHPADQREVPGGGPLGEVYVLAVHPRAQGMGVGRALLRAGLAHLRGRGCTEVILYVDADDAAVALYEGEGFTTLRDHRCYVGREAPAAAGSSAT